jgi:hypothetical protein
MSISININTTGPLHQNPDKHFKEAVETALDETLDYGRGLVRSVTPVRTGFLKAGWESNKTGWDSASIDNDVRYAPFVEARQGFVVRSTPQIQEYFTETLNTLIEERMN